MLKRVFMIIALVVMTAPVAASAQPGEKGLVISGDDWNQWPRGVKEAFVLGWGVCGGAAFDAVPVDMNSKASVDYARSARGVFYARGVYIRNVTIEEVIDTVDAVYAQPGAEAFSITDVMPLVSGRHMSGWNDDEVLKITGYQVKILECFEEEGRHSPPCMELEKKRDEFVKKVEERVRKSRPAPPTK